MLRRRRLWARLLVIPALWSAVVAMSATPIHPCGGMEHAEAGAAVVVDAEHAEHAGHAELDAQSAGKQLHDDASTCDCVGCGTPAVVAVMPLVAFTAPAVRVSAAPMAWPAAARTRAAAPAHSLPFANAPPLS